MTEQVSGRLLPPPALRVPPSSTTRPLQAPSVLTVAPQSRPLLCGSHGRRWRVADSQSCRLSSVRLVSTSLSLRNRAVQMHTVLSVLGLRSQGHSGAGVSAVGMSFPPGLTLSSKEAWPHSSREEPRSLPILSSTCSGCLLGPLRMEPETHVTPRVQLHSNQDFQGLPSARSLAALRSLTWGHTYWFLFCLLR